MSAKAESLEDFLSSVLRGAAKLLGCGSTNLILINERTQEIRIRLGTMAASYPILDELEQVLGESFKGIAFPIGDAQDSLVYKSWRDRSIRETSSLAELVGSAIPRQVIEQITHLIGEHRFICVPALSTNRSYGILLFQKEGKRPYSPQQREVLLRYARRIGEILENDLIGQGQMLFSHLSADGADHLLFDSEGRLMGWGPEGSPSLGYLLETEEILRGISLRARAFSIAREASSTEEEDIGIPSDLHLKLLSFRLRRETCVLCTVGRRSRQVVSLENQLLQLTLGDVAPALFVDTDFVITSCNDATKPFLGFRAAELVHEPIGSLFLEPQEIVRILKQQILDPKGSFCEESTKVLRKDGSIASARVEALLLADDRDQAVGFLVVIREEADSEREPVDRLVRQERMATMGEMAAQLAHEIRNPLVAIGATLESMMRDPAFTEEQRTTLASLVREIVRMDTRIKDYLAARHEISLDEVNLASVVDDARRLLEGANKLSGKRITSSIAPDLMVRADYEALKHVFFNLLLNALEASPEEGTVSCRAALGRYDVSIHIEDDGPGLGATPVECFRPFFTTKKNGTGLGLAVCQKIARAHGGLVDLKNREGGGGRATVVLPLRAMDHGMRDDANDARSVP